MHPQLIRLERCADNAEVRGSNPRGCTKYKQQWPSETPHAQIVLHNKGIIVNEVQIVYYKGQQQVRFDSGGYYRLCGISSVGRAFALQARGQQFEPTIPYHQEAEGRPLKRSPRKEPNDAVGILGIGSMGWQLNGITPRLHRGVLGSIPSRVHHIQVQLSLVERPAWDRKAVGSNPTSQTIQDTSPIGRGVGFKLRMLWVRIPRVLPHAWVAQSVERGTENPCVGGSIPPLSTICSSSSVGRTPPCQGGGHGFETRLLLHCRMATDVK